ncbi:allophanate hydrolase [Actinoplanes sp. ATCC 53533]|uniref:5-oxoprolinase subunit C family protein n=1 Tax=Actinoplanes sp. ATCC 53533 TaxID=1288362 RepID=UPI000F76E93B|nr:biotin-dependent carboxyltransferase family protein [Actinoplanes sp. ATCC 53533]RSM55477.1 allophanate hydrolase [Actinoplanes sp. ATCC 53533]
MTMTILRAGPLTVLKDEGRPGHAGQGVAPSGAVDRSAYARANALVGNPRGAAALECTLGGLRVRFDEPAVIVLTGTDAVLTVDGTRTAVEEVVTVAAGAEVAVTMPRRGLRSYLAVRGGFAAPVVLGSRSTDQLAGVGPPRPAPGDTLPIGPAPSSPATGTAADDTVADGTVASGMVAVPDEDGPLEVDLGPRDDWFTAAAIETFLSAEFTVSPASNSVGLRLDGPVLARARTEELPSEGVVRGSVQVPPDGHPIVFQADHPVTGGYPVIAVLTPAAADRAAQARPGARLRFTVAPA